ncbi:hypothetical protein MBLNU457_6497t1 [Dothideomycetes sp. NU457]
MARCWLLRLFRRKASHRPDEETSTALSDLPPSRAVGTVSEDATGPKTPPPVTQADTQAAAGAVDRPIDQALQQRPSPNSSDPRQSTQPPLLPTSVAVGPVSRHRRGQAQSFRVNESWHYRNELRSLQPTQYNSSIPSRQDLPSQRHRRSHHSLLSQAPSPSRPFTPNSHPSPLRSHPSPIAPQPATQQPAQEFDTKWSDAAVQSRYKAALTASTSPLNQGRIRPLASSSSLRSSSSSLRANWTAPQRPPMPGRAPPYPPRTSSLPATAVQAPLSSSAVSAGPSAVERTSPHFSPTAGIPNIPITSRRVALAEGLPDPFGPSMWRMTPSRQASFNTAQSMPRPPMALNTALPPPAVPLKSALRRRPGDVPAVMPARAGVIQDDDDSDEMGYEGDVERR